MLKFNLLCTDFYFKKPNNIILYGIASTIGFGLCVYLYREYCKYHTFKKINEKYLQTQQWEKDLEIYSVSMPRFHISGTKKLKCILLIGGYKDIPYVWNEFEKYLIEDKMDFYAPRTCGNGRSFYQIVDWKDWVITYLEAIYILQEQYENIDIIGFSTGAAIAVYLSQFKYKCKINNLFLCAPFLTYKKHISIDIAFGSNIFSKILNRLYVWTFRFRPKIPNKFKGCRDTHNEYFSINDFCEIYGDLLMETILFDFIKFKPNKIHVKNIVLIYPNDDDIIGNIWEQKKIVEKISDVKSIDVIQIPSHSSNDLMMNKNLSTKSGHLMFKENPDIIQDIYFNIKKYL